MGLTAALGSERPGTTLGTYYMGGYYKQELNSESIYGYGGLFFGFSMPCRSDQRDEDHETLRGGK